MPLKKIWIPWQKNCFFEHSLLLRLPGRWGLELATARNERELSRIKEKKKKKNLSYKSTKLSYHYFVQLQEKMSTHVKAFYTLWLRLSPHYGQGFLRSLDKAFCARWSRLSTHSAKTFLNHARRSHIKEGNNEWVASFPAVAFRSRFSELFLCAWKGLGHLSLRSSFREWVQRNVWSLFYVK